MTRPHGLNRYKHGPDEHGTKGKGCRCATCRAAPAAYERHRYRMMAYGQWQSSLTDATGTQRRIQALMWNGWPVARLAARLGCSRNVLHLKLTRNKTVSVTVAAQVRALYDELWDQQAPAGTPDERRAAARARRYAREHGFVPAMAWDDDEIDDPAAVPADGWERSRARRWGILAEEAADLLSLGAGLDHAAERLGVSRSTLSTTLARARRAGARPEQGQERSEGEGRAA